MQEQTIFSEALEKKDHAERAAFLDQVCAGDPALRQRIERLLARHQESGSFLEPPARALVATVEETVSEGPGTVLGPYKLLEPIGEGGFGIVFMAEQQQPLRRKVALKLLKPGMDSKQVIARFEAERQALALMDHPHIAKVLDAGQTSGGRPYFVMDLVKGLSLTDFCDQSQLTARERLELFVDVCQAVQHAHQKGIIHRDLKPSNVLVTLQDGRPLVKVIDFGIAKALGQQLTDKTLFTGFAQMLGTPLYMSPEQAALSNVDVDTRSDIYSLGVLLYELLTGTTPFDKARLQQAGYDEMRRIIREEEPPRPSTRISTLGQAGPTVSAQRKSDPKRLSQLFRGELDWIVMKALDKDRNRRYETASAFAADVQRYLHDEPVQACPPSAWYRCRKFARRNKVGLAFAGLILFFVVLLGGGVGWMVRDRFAQQRENALQARESLTRARQWIAENKPALARQELAEAKGRLGTDRAALGSLAEEIESLQVGLAKIETFLALLDRAHEVEIPQALRLALPADTGDGTKTGREPASQDEQGPAKAAPLILQALSCYGVMEREDWSLALERSCLDRDQVTRVRRTVYEELLWLADDVLRRRQDHRSGRVLAPVQATREGLAYLTRAEAGHRPTAAFYAIRARCRKEVGDTGAARADAELSERTPAAIALDHYLRGLAAYRARNKADAVKHFEAALRVEPTHYWSFMTLGDALNLFGGQEADFVAAAVYTGCIMRRPDHARAYGCRGDAFLSLRRYEDGLADCSKAIELNPKLAQAWNNRGAAYFCLGDYAKALSDLSKAVELMPDNAKMWYNRGIAHVKLGQHDKAVADYSKAIELNPKFSSAWCNRGNAHHESGQHDKAVADFSKAIELNPKDALAWYNRGNSYLELGQHDKALAEYTKAIELQSDYVPAWYNRAIAYSESGQYDKALADYSKAIELKADHVGAWINRGNTYYKMGQHDKALANYSKAIELKPDQVSAWIGRGNTYDKMGQHDKALANYSKAIELKPDKLSAWIYRGDTYDKMGQVDKAIADYSKGIELKPDDAEAWSRRGRVYLQLGQLNKTITDCTKAIDLKPDLAWAWYNRGNAHLRLGQHGQALADCTKAIELKPDFAEPYFVRGSAYFKLGQLHKAIADCTKAIDLNPSDAKAWNIRGVVYCDGLRQYDKAVGDFCKAIERSPKEAIAWANRGNAYRGLGRWEQAVADYSKAVELDPNYHGVCNMLAWLLVTAPDLKLRNPSLAVELAKKAVQLQPNNGAYWQTLGVARYRTGDWKAAVAALEKVKELGSPGDSLEWFPLAMAHWQLGDKEQARKLYAKAVEWMEKNDPKNEELRRFRAEAAELLKIEDASKKK